MRRQLALVLSLAAVLGATASLPGDDPKDKPKSRPKDEALKLFADEFVTLTPGKDKFPPEFTMGSKEGPAAEKPAHTVKLATLTTTTISTELRAVARYEVTQELYEAVMGNNPSKWKGPRNSVEMVSWADANDFCKKATDEMRKAKLLGDDEVIRLPTEAEWEYACRAGTKTAYSFGDKAD